jgi:uncharacterized protein YgiM (DUF1202 family)
MGSHPKTLIWLRRVAWVGLGAAILAACARGTAVPPAQNPPTATWRLATPTVTPRLTPTAAPTATPAIAPALSLNPAMGGPRTQVTVLGVGFPARTPVSLKIAPSGGDGNSLTFGGVVADEQGRINIALVMPDRWSSGDFISEKELVFAVAGENTGVKATALFIFQPAVVVKPSPSPVPSNVPSAYVSFDFVNVRSGPGPSYGLVVRIDRGQALSLVGRNADGSWVQVRLPGDQAGWAPAASIEANVTILSLPVTAGSAGAPTLTEPSAQASAYVSYKWAYLRSGPGGTYSLIARLDHGEGLTLLGRTADNAWVQVYLSGGQQGWVAASYLEADAPIPSLPITTKLLPTPTPGEPGTEPKAYSAGGPLEVRAGPGSDYKILVVTAISRDQGMSLLGRNAEGTWVEARLPDGNMGWLMAASVQANLPISNLPVIAGPQPRIMLSNLTARSGMAIQVNAEGFLSNQELLVTLGVPGVAGGLAVARGKTDAKGAAQLAFAMPALWADGSLITESNLVLVVSNLDWSISQSVNLQYLR